MIVFKENFQHVQELQKQYIKKYVKPRNYVLSEKVWLNSKYIKTKWNCKLEAKFFGLFKVLHLVGKQAYKLELSKKRRIYDVFHVSLMEQNITRKEQVEITIELDKDNSKEYEVETDCNSEVYANELDSGHLLGLYYLVSWKSYSEEENT